MVSVWLFHLADLVGYFFSGIGQDCQLNESDESDMPMGPSKGRQRTFAGIAERTELDVDSISECLGTDHTTIE
jgi:hypothetical protein